MRAFLTIGICSVLGTSALFGQQDVCIGSKKLGCLLPNLFHGPTPTGTQSNGLTLPVSGHNAHFTAAGGGRDATLPLVGPLNSALGNVLSLIPVASPASGLILTFDPGLGVYTQSEQNLGAILSERAETLGKRRVFIGFTYQHFNFTTLDGQDLSKLPVIFKHEQTGTGIASGNPAINDVITTLNNINFSLNQYTTFLTIGLTNRIDFTAAIPVVDTNLSGKSAATLQRFPNPALQPTHFFDANNQVASTQATFQNGGSASGLGDVTLRVKGTLWKGESSSVAFGTDVRLPSGDEMNLLGTGAAGVKPFFAFSGGRGRFSPHLNIGYQFNGKSILAGNTLTGEKGRLPGQFIYSLGTEVGLNKYASLSYDFLGQSVIHGQRILTNKFDASRFANQFDASDIRPIKETFHIFNGAVGVKLQPTNKLFLTANLMFKLNNAGLRSKLVPLVGMGYVF